nr:DDE-type integrase/transposase/recombinase [Pseudonocardia alni]
MIDDHSRVAHVEPCDHETMQTATAILRNAVARFAARGFTVKRVISDNGACVLIIWSSVHHRSIRSCLDKTLVVCPVMSAPKCPARSELRVSDGSGGGSEL